MSTWNYVKNGQKEGPIDTDQIKQLISSGTLPSTALVWKAGMTDWVEAKSLPEFSGSISAPAIPSSTAAASDASDADANKAMGILAYIFLLFIVPLIVARQSKFAMYHTNQGLILFIAGFILSVGISILGGALLVIPYLGWILYMGISSAASLGWLVFAVLGIINAAQGACKPLPIIGNFTIIK
jgi:uncharacterized membrane protein